VALGAAHDQGRALDRVRRRPQEVAPARVSAGIDLAAVALIVLPHEAPVRHPAQVVQEAPAQQLAVAPWVEGGGALAELLGGARRGLKASARPTNCSTESSGVVSEVNAWILRTPSNRISGPTSTRTRPA